MGWGVYWIWKRDKSVFYNSGVLLKYRQEGDYLVFDQDYANVTILYHGIIVDMMTTVSYRQRSTSISCVLCL